MNSQIQDSIQQNKDTKLDQSIQIYESQKWDNKLERLVKTKIQIIFPNTQEIIYVIDGQIIRKDQIKEINIKPEVLKNLEQIKYLEWQGAYGANNKKVDNWSINWKGQPLQGVGGMYSQEGKKQGLWKELIQDFRDEAQVYEIGEYQNGNKIGKWIFMFKEQEIGGGQYNEQGRKTGSWIDLSENFWNENQIIYNGDYSDGRKVGRWDISFEGKQLDGGSYDDNVENPRKSGKWVELSDSFWGGSLVFYHGDYENGKKVGSWDTYFNLYEKIGGGSYDQDSSKVGSWVELSDGFSNSSQVSYSGEYKNNQKVGQWDIFWNNYGENRKIGGGQYDIDGNSTKIGKWIEPSEGYINASQITYIGYYKNNKRVGQWDIFWNQNGENQKIGGGQYDGDGNSTKIGNWIELSNQFQSECQVTYCGKYENGQKVGQWDIFLNYYGENKKIGGGSYVDKLWADGLITQVKTGKWVDLSDEFDFYEQITQIGEYKDGQRIGTWDVIDLKNNQKIKELKYE